MASTLVSQHASTSGLQIALHPLALLTISDYITRHVLRRQSGPMVGALLGHQNGRELSIEYAYEIVMKSDTIVDTKWFEDKLRLFKETHPASDLIGWFTTSHNPAIEPLPQHVEIHQALLPWNESPLLLLLNPAPLAGSGGKLPIAIYESIYEASTAGDDKTLSLKFVPLPYTIESGEAEMIGMDFVAKGAGNASSVPTTSHAEDAKGKGKAAEADVGAANDELLSNLTAKKNAIQMLNSRIKLLLAYLQNPPDGVTNHQILREIKSLTQSRLPLLRPADEKGWQLEKIKEEGDVNLVVLLGAVTRCIEDVRAVGWKSAGIEQVLKSGKKGMGFDEGFEFGMGGGGQPQMGPRRSTRGMGLFGY